MAKKEERFVKTYSQGMLATYEVIVDRQTGVNYLYYCTGAAAGLTVLLDGDGRPVITPIPEPDEE